MPFFVIFILIPLAEIMVFMAVSDYIGVGMAFLMALFTAILGGAIVKHQGIQTLMTAQAAMQRGEMPAKELFDGLCLIASGATLITPGFITDAIGFSLLVPAVRDVLRQKIVQSGKLKMSGFNAEYSEFHNQKQYHRPSDPDVIDVEYETIDKE